MTSVVHYLKSFPEPFEAVVSGLKRHEVRVDDRGYQSGDCVVLREWDPATGQHTGRETSWMIGNITRGGTWGLPAGICAFTLLPRLSDHHLYVLAKESST